MRSIGAILPALLLPLLLTGTGSAVAAPEGRMSWAVHVSLAPTWFDPAETPGITTPFGELKEGAT